MSVPNPSVFFSLLSSDGVVYKKKRDAGRGRRWFPFPNEREERSYIDTAGKHSLNPLPMDIKKTTKRPAGEQQ